MGFISAIFIFLVSTLFLLFMSFSLFLLKIYSQKSIRNPEYPPVHGTIFHQLFYFNRLYDHQTEAARECPTFRLLGPDQSDVHTVDPRNVEHVLKTNFDKYTKGEYNRSVFADLFGEGIFVVDGDKWRQQRKLASFEFSTRVLRDFSCSVFRKNAAKLLGVVRELAAGGVEFDVQEILMRSALDSIIKVGFGADLNCLEGSTKDKTKFMKAFDDANALIYWRYIDPFWKLKRFLNVGAEARLRQCIETIDCFVHQLISTKREQLLNQQDSIVKEDILSRFLVQSAKDSECMNDRYLRDIILNFMLAGKDSTANTLSWFLYMLCKNPLVQEKVFQEIKEVIGDNTNDGADFSDFMEKITEAVLYRMHYLHATLTETLRLYPAVPMDGRCSEIDDVLPDGYKLKKGDGVYYMIYAMGRMTSLWGEDAEDFRPERWLRDGTFEPESPFKFAAFNAGPRTCLGKDFAYRQMKITSIGLLWFFRFQLVDESATVTYQTMFTLHMKGGLHVRTIPRMKLQPV